MAGKFGLTKKFDLHQDKCSQPASIRPEKINIEHRIWIERDKSNQVPP